MIYQYKVVTMKQITRFKGKKITIDGIVGTIHQPTERGFCEFVYRTNGNGVEGVRIAARYMRSVGVNTYKTHGIDFDMSKKDYCSVIQSWACCFPSWKYIERDQSLQKAGC